MSDIIDELPKESLVAKRAKILEIKKEVLWISAELYRIKDVDTNKGKCNYDTIKRANKLHASFLHVRMNEIIDEMKQIGVQHFDHSYRDMVNDLVKQIELYSDEKYHIRPQLYTQV